MQLAVTSRDGSNIGQPNIFWIHESSSCHLPTKLYFRFTHTDFETGMIIAKMLKDVFELTFIQGATLLPIEGYDLTKIPY